MAVDFAQWRKHIDHVVRDEGQWLGILDENCWPILELPPVVSLTGKEVRLSAESVELTVPVEGVAGQNLVDMFLMSDLSSPGASQQLVLPDDPARFIALVRAGERRVFMITHAVAPGNEFPHALTLHGVELLEGLSWWPCPSIPVIWTEREFMSMDIDAGGSAYKTPRDLALLEFASVADGFTKQGPARSVLRELVQDSFDAVNALYGWDDPHAVVDFGGVADTTARIVVRVDDSTVWDTIAEPARVAGIDVQVDLWWPGDEAVVVRSKREPLQTEPRSWDRPMQIVRIQEVK